MSDLPETNENRIYLKMMSGLKVYQVRLKGGPCDGGWSIASHNTVICQGQTYRRGEGNLYVHEPKAGGRN